MVTGRRRSPVLQPTLAGHHRAPQRSAASSLPVPGTLGARPPNCIGPAPGAPPPPCGTQGGAPRLRPPPPCPGQVAWGTGAGPMRGVLELRAKTSAMTETRPCTPPVAPRAWAGERAPGHLPLLHTRMQLATKVSNGPKAPSAPPQARDKTRCASFSSEAARAARPHPRFAPWASPRARARPHRHGRRRRLRRLARTPW